MKTKRKPKITRKHLALILRLTRERDLARRAVYFVPPKEGSD
jgi:predicted molibdopterin-dependent oxidoreductase YjgC